MRILNQHFSAITAGIKEPMSDEEKANVKQKILNLLERVGGAEESTQNSNLMELKIGDDTFLVQPEVGELIHSVSKHRDQLHEDYADLLDRKSTIQPIINDLKTGCLKLKGSKESVAAAMALIEISHTVVAEE